jgi:hypothetical protein
VLDPIHAFLVLHERLPAPAWGPFLRTTLGLEIETLLCRLVYAPLPDQALNFTGPDAEGPKYAFPGYVTLTV